MTIDIDGFDLVYSFFPIQWSRFMIFSTIVGIYLGMTQLFQIAAVVKKNFSHSRRGISIRWTVFCMLNWTRCFCYGLPVAIYLINGIWNVYSAVFFGAFLMSLVVSVQIHRELYRYGRPHHLISTGWFRWCAHPYYACWLIYDLSLWGVRQWSTTFVVSGIAFYILLVLVCRDQERDVMLLFGDEAVNYYWRTPSVHALVWRFGLDQKPGNGQGAFIHELNRRFKGKGKKRR